MSVTDSLTDTHTNWFYNLCNAVNEKEERLSTIALCHYNAVYVVYWHECAVCCCDDVVSVWHKCQCGNVMMTSCRRHVVCCDNYTDNQTVLYCDWARRRGLFYDDTLRHWCSLSLSVSVSLSVCLSVSVGLRSQCFVQSLNTSLLRSSPYLFLSLSLSTPSIPRITIITIIINLSSQHSPPARLLSTVPYC